MGYGYPPPDVNRLKTLPSPILRMRAVIISTSNTTNKLLVFQFVIMQLTYCEWISSFDLLTNCRTCWHSDYNSLGRNFYCQNALQTQALHTPFLFQTMCFSMNGCFVLSTNRESHCTAKRMALAICHSENLLKLTISPLSFFIVLQYISQIVINPLVEVVFMKSLHKIEKYKP